MLRNLLLAFDFSSSSERALRYALDLRERTDATLHLACVKEVPMGPIVQGDPSPVVGEDERRERIQKRLKGHVREVVAHRGAPGTEETVRYHVARSGAVAPWLVGHAEEVEADLLVMGTQGHRGLQEAFVGSVAREVLRTAPCPVLTTRQLADEQASTDVRVNRVVAPVDFSDPSRAAVRYAGRVASIYEVPTKLVHVVESPRIPSVYEVESPKLTSRVVKARAEQALDEWGAELLDGTHGVTYVVHQGDPAGCLLESTSKEDVLVMATRGLSGLRRTMLGSVTEEVVRKAQGPVLAGQTFPTEP
jgi:nucleotide-binding universal stress UspA family protein